MIGMWMIIEGLIQNFAEPKVLQQCKTLRNWWKLILQSGNSGPSCYIPSRPALSCCPLLLSSFMMSSTRWFIELLECERAKFDHGAYPLPKHQKDAFDLCCDLLKEEETSLAKRSKQRRSTRSRAHTLLSDVFLGVGPEVFLLCTLCTTISKLATIPLKSLIPELRRWWKTVSRPAGLTETAKELCTANFIGSLVTADRKRQHSEVTVDAGMPGCSIPDDLVTDSQQSKIHHKASTPVCLRANRWDLFKGIKIKTLKFHMPLRRLQFKL